MAIYLCSIRWKSVQVSLVAHARIVQLAVWIVDVALRLAAMLQMDLLVVCIHHIHACASWTASACMVIAVVIVQAILDALAASLCRLGERGHRCERLRDRSCLTSSM